jgi:hypothetical protein
VSILCDLFVADPSDASKYGDRFDDPEWAAHVESVSFGGLTQLNFEILWAILEGRPWDPSAHSFEWVGDPPPEGQAETWTFRFAPAFVSQLAALEDPRAITEITQQWARTEELSCDPKDLTEVVDSLLRLARSAQASGGGLCLWGSL